MMTYYSNNLRKFSQLSQIFIFDVGGDHQIGVAYARQIKTTAAQHIFNSIQQESSASG